MPVRDYLQKISVSLYPQLFKGVFFSIRALQGANSITLENILVPVLRSP